MVKGGSGVPPVLAVTTKPAKGAPVPCILTCPAMVALAFSFILRMKSTCLLSPEATVPVQVPGVQVMLSWSRWMRE